MFAKLEKIPERSGRSFLCQEYEKAMFDHSYHYHPEIELTLVMENHGQRLVGDVWEPFEAGDLVLLGANLPHQYRNWKKGRARSRFIQFLPDAFGTAFFDLPEFRKIRGMLRRSDRGLCFSPEIKVRAIDQMTKLFRTEIGPDRFSCFIELLAILSSDHEMREIAGIKYEAPVNQQHLDRIQRVLEFLDQNWNQDIALKDVAEKAALHPQSLSRFFQKHLGKTYKSYLGQLRLNHAANQILDTDDTIAAIAFSCGYNNLANFNRQFKCHYDITPSGYRKLHRS